MTNERIDHVAEARKCIAWAQDQQEREGEFDGSVRDNALLAQAEATLALVEQQRVANLLRVHESLTKREDYEAASELWRDHIAAALGIKGGV